MEKIKEVVDLILTFVYFLVCIIYIFQETGLAKTEMITYLLFVVVWWYISKILHILIHELGHYIAGKIGGFDLYYLSIYFFTFYNNGERWTVCKNKNRTVGQCLMTPKSSSSNGKLYLSGGYIMTVLIIFI